MAQRYNRPPHSEGPFDAERVADSSPPDAAELRAFGRQMRERALQRTVLFLAALALAAALVWATRHEPEIAQALGASPETVDTALLIGALGAVLLWGYTLFRVLEPILHDWLGARADLEPVDREAPEVNRVLVCAALISQDATGYIRAVREESDRDLRAGDLRALRQFLRQVKTPAEADALQGPPSHPEDDRARGFTVWSEHGYRFFLDPLDTLEYIEFLDGPLAGVAIYFGRPGEGRFPYTITDCPEHVWSLYDSLAELEDDIDAELEEVLQIFGGWGQPPVLYY